MKNYAPINQNIASSYSVIYTAVAGKSEILSDYMRRFGKRARANWIARQGYANYDTKTTNFLATIKIWIAAFIFSGNHASAELILLDINNFAEMCRRQMREESATATNELPKGVIEKIRNLICEARALEGIFAT